jgi:hypothetical protein
MNQPITIEHDTGAIVSAQAFTSAHEIDAQRRLTEAQAYHIDCPELAEAAAEDLGAIKAKIKELDEQRKSMTRPLDESKKRIMDLFAKPLAVLEAAEQAYKKAIGQWQEAERKRLAEERRLQEEATRKAQEALAAQQKAEQERLQVEAEEAARKAKEAAASGDEEAAAAAQVAATMKSAELAVAQEVGQQEVAALGAMVPAASAVPEKLAGISTSTNFKAEVTDLMALVKAVAEGKASIELLEPNTKVINQRAKALKLEFVVPGIRVYADQVISARAKKV